MNEIEGALHLMIVAGTLASGLYVDIYQNVYNSIRWPMDIYENLYNSMQWPVDIYNTRYESIESFDSKYHTFWQKKSIKNVYQFFETLI